MVARAHQNGRPIKFNGEHWIYCDTGELAKGKRTEGEPGVECGHCGLVTTEQGHDGCLGLLNPELVINACCGHGKIDKAYVHYINGDCVRGVEAIRQQERLKS